MERDAAGQHCEHSPRSLGECPCAARCCYVAWAPGSAEICPPSIFCIALSIRAVIRELTGSFVCRMSHSRLSLLPMGVLREPWPPRGSTWQHRWRPEQFSSLWKWTATSQVASWNESSLFWAASLFWELTDGSTCPCIIKGITMKSTPLEPNFTEFGREQANCEISICKCLIDVIPVLLPLSLAHSLSFPATHLESK